jgi:hypothetical protein
MTYNVTLAFAARYYFFVTNGMIHAAQNTAKAKMISV